MCDKWADGSFGSQHLECFFVCLFCHVLFQSLYLCLSYYSRQTVAALAKSFFLSGRGLKGVKFKCGGWDWLGGVNDSGYVLLQCGSN